MRDSTTVRATDDCEVVAASAAGDLTGVVAAYDEYAVALYGYCYWMVGQPTDAAEALGDTFAAAITLGDLLKAPKLRPRLYAVARNECLRRLPTAPAMRGEKADAADRWAGVNGDLEQAELRTLVHGILAELTPSEREAIELNLTHDLYDADLTIVLGASWSQAHALASRARGRLEDALGPLLIVRTGQEACPALAELLIGWDGQLTDLTRDLLGGHIEQCQVCAGRSRSALRPTVLSAVPPMAALPPELREQILGFSSDIIQDAVADRRQMAQRTQSLCLARFSHAIGLVRWDHIRSNPGLATAIVVVVLWAMAAVSVTVLAFAGSHPGRALVVLPSVSTTASSPTVAPATFAAPAPMTPSTSASAKPSPTVSQPLHVVLPPSIEPSASPIPTASPSPSHSAKPSKSPSPKPSKSPSPSPSGSASQSSPPTA